MLALQLALLAGAETMLLTLHPAKHELARVLGVSETAATPQDAAGIWPDGADLTFECAGVPETVAGASPLTGRGGRIVVLGVLPKAPRCRSTSCSANSASLRVPESLHAGACGQPHQLGKGRRGSADLSCDPT
jgi:threonine dehydrogenase-like Zn-dependent dehydrogenase